jgi:hypothetical protein
MPRHNALAFSKAPGCEAFHPASAAVFIRGSGKHSSSATGSSKGYSVEKGIDTVSAFRIAFKLPS